MWFKWHLLNFNLQLKSLLGGLSRTAMDEVHGVSYKKTLEAKIAAGKGLPYEEQIAAHYYEFWNVDFSNMGRMNLYFFLIITTIVIAIVRFAIEGINQQVMSEDYFLMSVLGIGGLVLVLFIYEVFFHKTDNDEPVTEEEYQKAKTWMHYISEKARHPMPWWAMLIVGIGLVIEAGAISIIAASFVTDVSKNESMYIGIVLGIIVAAGLGWLIHKAGESLYRQHHRKSLHRVIRNEGGYVKNEQGKYISETYSALKTDKNNFRTDEDGFWKRNGIMLSAVVVILTLATLAFIQRAELNLDIIKGQQQIETTELLLSPDIDLMPSEVSNAQQNAQNDIVEEKVSHAEKGMYAALGVLTLVFLIINGVGIMFGYKYCFYDEHSEEYYKIIKKYKEQMALHTKDFFYATLARQKVLKKSNQFFTKFQRHAVKQARREGLDSLQEALNERGAYRMETYVAAQQSKGESDEK